MLAFLAAYGTDIPVFKTGGHPAFRIIAVTVFPLVTAGVAFRIAVIVIRMGCIVLFFLASGTGMPMTSFVTGPLRSITVDMILLRHNHISAGQAYLLFFLSSSRTGNVLCKIRLFPTLGTLMPVALIAL